MNKIIKITIIGLLIFSACKPEPNAIFELNPVELSESNINKTRQKSQTQFISVLYTDLFAQTISNAQLTDLSNLLTSFGDKQAFNEMLVNKWLNEPTVQIPNDSEMRADVSNFIDETYANFFGRKASELEKQYLKDFIETDSEVTPKMIYASFILSNEYLFY